MQLRTCVNQRPGSFGAVDVDYASAEKFRVQRTGNFDPTARDVARHHVPGAGGQRYRRQWSRSARVIGAPRTHSPGKIFGLVGLGRTGSAVVEWRAGSECASGRLNDV
jgi:lactate dehydrogenase-like 2-hydroxyacid dehydrogenase